MNTGFMGNNREFLSNRCFFCDLGEMPQHSFMTTFYPHYLLLQTIFASSPTYLFFNNFAVFFAISISISISVFHFFQYQDQDQDFGLEDFKIKININILENLNSISRSRSTWPIYWKILENQYIVPSLVCMHYAIVLSSLSFLARSKKSLV